MNFTTKFNIGDIVAGISHQDANRLVNCYVCKNTGKVKIEAEEYICPKCDGKGQQRVWEGKKWYVMTTGKVGDIRIEHNEDILGWDGDLDYKAETKILYMLDSTGVKSGQVWSENELFQTREEAQSICDSRNVKLPADEIAA